jgi:4-amino-4-deoxy-L-arabinose transferase-like glycosyltransferase
MPPSKMTARRAAWIGLAWVNGSVLVAYGLGFAIVGWVFTTQKALLDKLGPWSLILIALALVAPWLIWSWQVTRWRLWAYRRVQDLEALKGEAIALSVIWPSGHLFEKTEFRTRTQKLELQRLERARLLD